jgi:transcriptional regulator with XRE-family HTH domain
MPRPAFTDAHEGLREALIAARKDAGVTQEELADRIDKPQQFISKIERGDRRVDVVELIAICRALKLDPKEVFATILRRVPKTFEI